MAVNNQQNIRHPPEGPRTNVRSLPFINPSHLQTVNRGLTSNEGCVQFNQSDLHCVMSPEDNLKLSSDGNKDFVRESKKRKKEHDENVRLRKGKIKKYISRKIFMVSMYMYNKATKQNTDWQHNRLKGGKKEYKQEDVLMNTEMIVLSIVLLNSIMCLITCLY